MIRALLIAATLAACSPAPPAPPLAIPPPVQPAPLPPPKQLDPLAAAPAQLHAQLARVDLQEIAIVAAPSADAATIAHLSELDGSARKALANLERDGGRHVTPSAVSRARDALAALISFLNTALSTTADRAPP